MEIYNSRIFSAKSELSYFRNTLVHHTDVIFTNDSIEERIKDAIRLLNELKIINETDI